MAVREREHDQADAESEQAAARQGRELDDQQEREHHREPDAQAVPAAEPEVDRQQDEQRDDQHDPEVVRVAGERVRPVHPLTVDGAVDVDRARSAGDRRENGAVEVASALGDDELEDAVGGVEDETRGEDRERPPVEALAAPGEVRDACDQEGDVDQPLEDPFAELADALGGVDVEVAGEVDEQ